MPVYNIIEFIIYFVDEIIFKLDNNLIERSIY